MSEPFVGEIRILGCNFAPKGWAFCNGQIMPISQNTALFSLLGTYYGGDGKSTFALPNLQGSAPMHQGQGPGLSDRVIGETGGEEAVTLINSEMPSHSHPLKGVNGVANQVSPANNTWAGAAQRPYLTTQNGSFLNPFALSVSGGSQPHNNMPPYLTLNFCIALQGVYPARP
jgi:microcystin-dependent protein